MMEWIDRLPGVSCVRPAGAFYIFPNISALGMGSTELAEDLLKKARIAVVPGVAFGWDSHLRMSFADSLENLEKGMKRFQDYLTR